MNHKQTVFQDKVDTANTAMKNMRLPEITQKQVQEFIFQTESTLDNQQEMDKFINAISPSLKDKVTQHIFGEAMKTNALFSDNKEMQAFMIRYLTLLLKMPEDEICTQGEIGESLYFIAKGECSVYVMDQNKKQHYTQELTVGEYFGEVALVKHCRRTASV